MAERMVWKPDKDDDGDELAIVGHVLLSVSAWSTHVEWTICGRGGFEPLFVEGVATSLAAAKRAATRFYHENQEELDALGLAWAAFQEKAKGK